MDAVWLILDSLSFSATPFCSDGPDTMPGIERLASDHGVVFTRAYAPGTKSPSSHGSFFTGELPSRTGMHEAYPYFDGELDTVADVIGKSHETTLVTSNSYVLNGLEEPFDSVDDLVGAEYMLFEDATDPRQFANETEIQSPLRRYLAFLCEDSKPLRSLANGLNFKRIRHTRESVLPLRGRYDDHRYQYAQTTGRAIEKAINRGERDTFVVANCMDIHPPLEASDEALELFCSEHSRDDLPIAVNGKDVRRRAEEGDKDVVEAMYDLINAVTWDVDRALTPLVEKLVDDGAFVAITADHGTWFRRGRLDEELMHVPLVLFAPGEQARTVESTVNLMSLPVTTMETTIETDGGFSGVSFFDVTEDQMSVTEYIHSPETNTSPVDPYGNKSDNIVHEVAAVRGATRVDFRDYAYHTVRGDESTAELLREVIGDVRSGPLHSGGDEPIEYDETTKQRLREFGYL